MNTPVHQYAFFFDSAACSGCKACQIACKDKHDLAVGILWRRVYEVTGGNWEKEGEGWKHSVVAYHLSMGCNHCESPACMDVCPTQAIGKRDDGIVLIDQDRCMGCRYCSWACPYGALQFDEARGRMTKCTFCADALREGFPPACVAACPMRAMDFGDLEVLRKRYPQQLTFFPLPYDGLTHPALVTSSHAHASALNPQAAIVVGHHTEIE